MAEREAAAREYARAHPGVPLLWATDEPVPDTGRVWRDLHEMARETGLHPITLAFTSVREIADYVKDAPFWGFWWD